ncbi:non-ribosomal peptide synthetase [Actinokineospora auranticolor]|uniref:Amino acid adenylation domain-containing protein n=1 Tax=Actinokineospora auranticolor TaxID=155976 RepID=A0A2S6H231_9PSEU|nr:non-ribosomal peptide synthetase [Actinokineospora auranticolor]PPK71466.1 amino acid adenylation domain-containing protein [Actinokineospora auranticolor]
MLDLPQAERQAFADGAAPAPHLDLVHALSFRAAGAALRLGVFDHLGDEPRTAAAVAAAIGGDPRGVRVLLDALTGFGYTTRDDDGYRATPAAAWFGTGYRAAFSFWHRVLSDRWTDLEQSIVDGKPPRDFYAWLAVNPNTLNEFQSMLAELADAVAPAVVAAVPGAARRLLDIGGGHARYATACCAANPDLRADVIDLPGSFDGSQAPDRVRFREADWTTDDLGVDYDVVLVFNVLHCLRPDRAEDLLRRAAQALRPGGTILILEETADVPTEAGALGAAWVPASSLNLFHTQGGQIYDRAHFAEWLSDAGFSVPDETPIAAAPTFTLFAATKRRTTGRALTATQRQMLAFDRLHPDSTWYNVPLTARISGALDVPRLRAALRRSWQRHESLRCTHDGDTAMTGVTPQLREVTVVSEAELAQLRERELCTRFDLTHEAPLRATLAKIDDDHELILVTHHIATDGYSLTVLRQDILDGYADPTRPSTTAHRPVQAGNHDADLAFWDHALADLPDDLALPFAATGDPSLAADVVRFRLPDDVTATVRQTARTRRSSPFMILLTAFGVLLDRLGGGKDVVIGTPVAGRDTPGSEAVVDCLVNMVALRLRLSEARTWSDAMDTVRSTALDAFDHANAPFSEVVDRLSAPRSTQHPVFQVVFAAPPTIAGRATVDGVTFDFVDGTSTESLFDIEVQVLDAGDSMGGYLKFRTTRFTHAQMTAVLDQFQNLLAGLDPTARLSDATLLTPEQRHCAVVEWNDTATDYPRDSTLVELVEARADERPNATAAIYGDDVLTYRELDERANRLAALLRDRGIGPEDRVGVRLGFGTGWAVSALAVLKAGAAYVPLDPAYPAARLDHMCADSGVEIVITDEVLRDSLAFPPDRTASPATPDTLAYVMYTSGSTGQPKGVGVTHRNIVRLVRDTNYVCFGPDDAVAQVSTPSFDAATFELWGPLCAGGRIIGVPKDDLLSPPELAKTLRDNDVALMFLTTSLARRLAATAPDTLTGVRQLLVGGERLDADTVARLRSVPGLAVVNGYGPTETTTFGVAWAAGDVPPGAVVPIGRPIANSSAYVLDACLQPVAPGMVGEIHLGGDGVARGYLGKPDLTATRFVADPFGAPGSRLYRTGDLGRYRTDGLIECLGRVDRQAKIRGFRVEPGEVEAALRETGRVVDVTVQVRVDEELLVGYVVPVDPAESMADLRAHLAGLLPDHLVPTVLVALVTLPTTPNGKLDTAALPDPFSGAPTETTAEPTTETERIVRDIWREVLGNPDIGVHDDFFALGGHSVKAGQVMARIRAEFQVPVTLRLVFDNPTVAALAAALPVPR